MSKEELKINLKNLRLEVNQDSTLDYNVDENEEDFFFNHYKLPTPNFIQLTKKMIKQINYLLQ